MEFSFMWIIQNYFELFKIKKFDTILILKSFKLLGKSCIRMILQF